jgi:hypothetical protein
LRASGNRHALTVGRRELHAAFNSRARRHPLVRAPRRPACPLKSQCAARRELASVHSACLCRNRGVVRALARRHALLPTSAETANGIACASLQAPGAAPALPRSLSSCDPDDLAAMLKVRPRPRLRLCMRFTCTGRSDAQAWSRVRRPCCSTSPPSECDAASVYSAYAGIAKTKAVCIHATTMPPASLAAFAAAAAARGGRAPNGHSCPCYKDMRA